MKKPELLLIVALNSLLIIFSVSFMKSFYNREKSKSMQNMLKTAAFLIKTELQSRSEFNLQGFDLISRQSGVELLLFEKNGRLVYPLKIADPLQQFKKIFSNLNSSLRFWQEEQTYFHLIGFSLGNKEYYLQVSSRADFKLVPTHPQFFLALILLFLLNLSWLFFLKNREKLLRLVKKYAGKNWNRYESDKLNVQKLFSELKKPSEEQSAEMLTEVFRQIPLQVFLTDENGMIIKSSAMCAEEFGLSSGKEFWQILRAPQLLSLFKEAVSDRQNRQTELIFNGIIYKVDLQPSAKRTVLFILKKIEISESERQQEFLLSLAHELRTPLTALKGFSETLDEDPANISYYQKIIMRQIERMILMVESILRWQAVETKKTVEEFDLISFLRELVPLFSKQAARKGLEFELISDCQQKKIISNRDLLEQLCFIFFDNALKFTSCGKISIQVESAQQTILSFCDTGCGFDRKLHERIFEPFFVVEKSRARTSSGYGLGLTIASKIARQLGLKIEVDSEIKRGSEFRIIFPAEN